jgi:hypothetical protein
MWRMTNLFWNVTRPHCGHIMAQLLMALLVISSWKK